MVLFPRRGLHQQSYNGGPLWQPETDEALFQALRAGMNREIHIREVDAHINDPAFSQEAAAAMIELLEGGKRE
jgi:uncharacterized protein (UPF0261 family)